MEAKWNKTVFAETQFVKTDTPTKKEVMKFEVASVNGKDLKLYVRTWEQNRKSDYDGPTREGFSLTWQQLQEFKVALRRAEELFSQVPPPQR
jgi:hypothetical protein